LLDIINEQISRYGLEEELEYIIIPFTGDDGRRKRCFLLKRKFIRVMYPDRHCIDYPLNEIIEATVRYPELPVTEALCLLQQESPFPQSDISGSECEKETEE
jgi:hypothetical protein